MARYAIYYCPVPGTTLHQFGAAWLGSEPAAGVAEETWRGITRDARRYGFHATLKPPFALADGCSLAELRTGVAELASSLRPVEIGRLQVATIDRFIALVTGGDTPDLEHLAECCVVELDKFRRPPDEAELAKRRQAGLTARQDELLQRFGYPYVLDEFRFHMTLTDRQDDPAIVALLERLAAPALSQAVRIIDLSLVEEAEPGAKFTLVERFALGV